MSDAPKTVTDWIKYLHNAAQTPKDSPDYGEAQDAMHAALLHIQSLNRVAGNTDAINAEPTTTQAVIGGALQGASMGLGEPISGAASAIQGKGFRAGAQSYRNAYANLQEAHPYANLGGELGGTLALGLAPGVQGAAAGKVLPGLAKATSRSELLQLAERATPIARATGQGAVLGGVAGASQGGEDPGDWASRLRTGGKGALLGAVLSGGLAGKGGLSRGRFAQARQQLAKERAELSAPVAPDALPQGFTAGVDAPGYAKGSITPGSPGSGQLDEAALAQRDFQAGKISRADLSTAEARARGIDINPSTPPAPDPLETPAYVRRLAGPAPERVPATVLPIRGEVAAGFPESPTVPGNAPRPGHPIYRGTKAPTRSAEVRGGERLLPSASPTSLSGASLKDLANALQTEPPGSVLRRAIEKEVLSRGYQLQ